MKNPVVIGNYADPEARVYNDTLYLYVTRSLPYNEQKNLDVVVSKNLEISINLSAFILFAFAKEPFP